MRAAGAGLEPCPPAAKAPELCICGLLPGVKEGAFTFSLNSRANGVSLDLGAAAEGVVAVWVAAVPAVKDSVICSNYFAAPLLHCAARLHTLQLFLYSSVLTLCILSLTGEQHRCQWEHAITNQQTMQALHSVVLTCCLLLADVKRQSPANGTFLTFLCKGKQDQHCLCDKQRMT